MKNTPPSEIHENVVMQLRRIARAMDVYSKQLQKSGLTSSQLAVLRTLTARGPITAAQLSVAVELSQGTVTTVLDRLDSKGLIQRNRRAEDKRQVWISLTEKGQAAFRDAPSPLHLQFLGSFSELQDWEQTMILSALQRVARMMDVSPGKTGKRPRTRPHIAPNLDLLPAQPEEQEC